MKRIRTHEEFLNTINSFDIYEETRKNRYGSKTFTERRVVFTIDLSAKKVIILDGSRTSLFNNSLKSIDSKTVRICGINARFIIRDLKTVLEGTTISPAETAVWFNFEDVDKVITDNAKIEISAGNHVGEVEADINLGNELYGYKRLSLKMPFIIIKRYNPEILQYSDKIKIVCDGEAKVIAIPKPVKFDKYDPAATCEEFPFMLPKAPCRTRSVSGNDDIIEPVYDIRKNMGNDIILRIDATGARLCEINSRFIGHRVHGVMIEADNPNNFDIREKTETLEINEAERMLTMEELENLNAARIFNFDKNKMNEALSAWHAECNELRAKQLPVLKKKAEDYIRQHQEMWQ